MRQVPLLSTLIIVIALPLLSQEPSARRSDSTAQQRTESTRTFLGLGAVPDKAAAERGAPLYQASCSFCHGPQARGADGPNLVVSDVVLGDDHGERLVLFLKRGRPEKGMPSFSSVPDTQLKDISEFLHLEVETVANRGTYHLLNVLVGDPTKGEAYVKANCAKCHATDSFAHIAVKYRTPDLLQRNWIWPTRPEDHSLSVMATVKMADGTILAGRVIQISDFKITIVDKSGKTTEIDRGPGVSIAMKDPLQPHEELIRGLKNDAMHNVTAYLETLK
jgi:cytochrome c oxidase cbb3-type subunit III